MRWCTPEEHPSGPGAETSPLALPGLRVAKPGPPERTIYDARSLEKLPGTVVRHEGKPPSGGPATDEAYDGLGDTHRLYADATGATPSTVEGLPLDATVHYGERYDNAFWDGERMVFGDGDGEVFDRFTKSLSVIGHELAHGVTQSRAAWSTGASRARSTSRSPTSSARSSSSTRSTRPPPRRAGSSARASSPTGAGRGAALPEGTRHGVRRRRARQGSAAGAMDDYVQTSDDNGGVHINSGIPNHAFYLAARPSAATRGSGRADLVRHPHRRHTVAGCHLRRFAKATAALPRNSSARLSRSMTPCGPRGKL